MNRRAKRIEAAANRRLAKRARNNASVEVPAAYVEQLHQVQRLLMAAVRASGRVRVTDADVASLTEGDRIVAKRDAAGITLSFAAAETAPEPEPQEEAAP